MHIMYSRERSNPVEQFLIKNIMMKMPLLGRKFIQLAIYVVLFSMFSCTRRADAAPDCSLNFKLYPYSPSPSCLEADKTSSVRWGTLEAYPCCMDAHVAFAEALAVKANHSSSSIFLDTDEMLSCRDTLIQGHSELANCSFYEFSKLGTGVCYNESVDDISKKLGMQLNSLQAICNGTLKDWDNMSNSTACGDCYGNFTNETGFLNSVLSGERNVTEHIQDCGLALLIAMGASRIDEYQWVQSLNKCLVYEHLTKPKHKNNKTTAILVLSGLAVIFLVVFSVYHWKDIEERKEGEGKTKALGADESRLVRFSSEEILNAMNYSSPWAFLGEGSIGKVYKGKLPSGQFIAIKHICKDIPLADAFETEIKSFSKIRHANLVSLLGYCDENGEKYFVHEYCANGNLSQMLLGLNDKVLTWEQRVKIAYGCVVGLRFLHLCPDGCIVHRDIKPTNILLTESMKAKLADFGLLRIFKTEKTKVSIDVKDTMGYLDPEYYSQGRLTCSSDIYNFGMVLLELLSGRRAIDFYRSHRKSLVGEAQKVIQANPINLLKYADPRLNGEYSSEAFEILLKLAVLCTAPSHQGRPIVSDVYEEIQKALTISTSISF